ncbi:1-phosphatidylinositol 3-phosphate 5-kinase-like isoform X5 [Penaeus chinensis]|uniref:1-phosphatidylinositol 3-phosphate 5-kinase-like isoform X5 n=1 Tax=Penaeus chinensis TaxID=139456 RepID=UPI001FB63833|nr:1-phosphatidylinositol 3-phosphate 5-kinase-like isoform X5 [Penaeus chinensis]
MKSLRDMGSHSPSSLRELYEGMNDSISESSETSSMTSSVSSLVMKPASSGHDRTLPNVLTRIRNIIDNRGSTPQQYKDSDFKQYWLPDSVSRECYECEEKFTTFRRRHHCRVCGQIFCSRCCNSMIPGKIIGYTGELRVCTYCCKVVLSYLQSNNLAADVLADLRALQEELLPPTPDQSCNAQHHDAAFCSMQGSGTPSATPRGTLRRRPSLGFQEEKYAVRTRYSSGDFQVFGGQRDSDQMTAERQLLLRDSQQLHSLWSQMAGGVGGLPLASHRHRLKSFHNCFVGRDLIEWLLANDKASSRASAVAIGQALLEAGYVVCISQLEQVFVDDYVLYRPMRPSTGGSEQTAQEGLNRAQDGGQEPLWVKQITSMAESIEGEVDSNGSNKVHKEEPTHTVDTPTSITSSTSNYCLDLNVKDNVVSMRKPPHVSRHGSPESDQVDTRSPGMASTSGQVPYSTTVSAVLSANAQLPFSGDVMNSTAVMSDEVLQALRGHDSSQSYPRLSGWTQEEKLTQNDEECLMQQRLNAMWNAHETALLCQLLDSGGLSPSWAEVILPIVHTVTDIIRPDVKNDSDDMDIRQYVQFKKVPGGSRSECQILNGAVCTKNVADKSMATRLTDPQILLVASTIDYQRGNDNKLLALDNLLLQEADYLKNVVAKIVSYKPDIILVEKSIAFLAREYLQAHGITLVMNVKPSVMERVARCTQAEVVSSIDAQLTRPTLGMCHNFYTRSYPMPGKNKQKTLMFFDGCAMHLGCTIILRGATNAELKRVKRIMYFMVYAVYNWRLERAFLMDEYTLIPPLPSESFDLEDQVFEEELKSGPKAGSLDLEPMRKKSSAKKEDGETASAEQGATNRSRSLNSQRDPVSSSGEVSVSSSGTSDKAKLSQTISDFSDPLHSYLNSGTSPQEAPLDSTHTSLSVTEFSNTFRKALEDTIFSCSPYLKYTVPFFETEAGRNCILRKYFQKDLYFSVLLEKDKFTRKPRFSEMEVKESKDENQNVEVKLAHEFTKMKMTTAISDKDVRAMLADFRARGGQMRNICKCEMTRKELKDRKHYQLSIDKDTDAKVVVEGLSSDALGSVNTTTNNAKNTVSDFWSGQSGLMLTSDGRVDALHPFNHQRLSILFSSYSQASESPPAFCVNPWVLTMDFYGRNDIPLGAFLERYCFSPTYTCPSSECSVAVVDHIRKFVHDTGCVEVLLRRLDTNLDDTNAGTILMWSWCKTCREVTPMVPITLETWSLSFAKYLELRFYGGSFNRRGTQGCTHSLHHDHFQYFGYKNQVAVFKYNNITLREVALPPSKMSLCIPPITQASVVELIKGVAMQGYSAFSTILERVTSMSSECGSRWEPLLIEINKISEHQNGQRALFREKIESIQLQLTSPTLEARRLHPPTPNTTQEVTATMLAITDQVVLIKKLVAQVVSDWNAKVQDLLHLRKKEEKLEKAKVMASTSSGMPGLPRQSTSASISTSSAASAHATSSTGEMFSAPSHKQGCDTASVASSAALTGVSADSLSLSASFSELPGQDGQKVDGCDDEVDAGGAGNGESSDSPQAAETQETRKNAEESKENVQKALGKAYVTPTVSCLMDERDHTLLALAALTTSTLSPPASGSSALSLSSASSEILNSWENESDVSGGLQAVLPNQLTEAFSVLHRRQASDTCDGMIAGCSSISGSPGRGHERSLSDGGQTGIIKEGIDVIGERRLAATAVKNIISTFWSSSANLMVESPFGPNEHYLLLPEVKIPVVVYGDEPSSIIAHAMASQEYERQLGALKKRLKDMQKEGTNMRSSDKEPQLSQEDYDSSANEESEFCVSAATTDSEKNKSAKDFHIELQWNDQHAKFYCKIFFAEHFRQLRKMVFPFGEEFYIRSLSRCIAWEARGGKSGSVFCKSHDDRFILKEMSRLEMISFLDFGPAYVQYIVNCEKEQQPTVLTRIVGVYRIGYKNTTTNKAQRMDVLVMENLFYQRNITHKFDLKGSIRNRLVNTSGKEESELVLLDENLLRMACSSPLHVRPHSKTVLSRAIAADTVFLSQQLIMDYSLLVGIDSTANQLVVGIIDYIRTFTWDKKLETIIKGSVLAGGAGKLPTVVSPEVYRTRFCHAMDRYFLLTPDRWTGLGLGIDP